MKKIVHSIGMTVLKNGNNRHSSLHNERIALTAYPYQGRFLKPCLHPSAFQSVCRSMCDALHASTWEWTYTMCLGLYVSECGLLSQWQSSLFLCVGFKYVCVTHCLRSCLPCFQLSWLLGGSGRASFSLPSSERKQKKQQPPKLISDCKTSSLSLQFWTLYHKGYHFYQHSFLNPNKIPVMKLGGKEKNQNNKKHSSTSAFFSIGIICLRCWTWQGGQKISMCCSVAEQLFNSTWIIARRFHVSLQEFSPILQLVVFCPAERKKKGFHASVATVTFVLLWIRSWLNL